MRAVAAITVATCTFRRLSVADQHAVELNGCRGRSGRVVRAPMNVAVRRETDGGCRQRASCACAATAEARPRRLELVAQTSEPGRGVVLV